VYGAAVLSSRAVGGNGGVVLDHGKLIFGGAGDTPKHVMHLALICLYTSTTAFPHSEVCYEMALVCAMMACYMLESSECGNSVRMFIMAWACRW
jgi:hypothetical protein